jgi:hypothetical protein
LFPDLLQIGKLFYYTNHGAASRRTEQALTRRTEDQDPPDGAKPVRKNGKAGKPGWADGLRKLYDGVVAEPLPDSFEDLLRKLDQAGND